jgi:hypothetical protein
VIEERHVGGAPIEGVSAPVHNGRPWLRWVLTFALVGLGLAAIFGDLLRTEAGWMVATQRVQTFVTIFLGIFIEAAPFLLAGSLVSGLIAVFVDHSLIDRHMPRNSLLGAISGASLGLLFPVCECGVVPVTRRLYEKGLPLSIGVAFLMAAPVINPVVLFSTYAAFGFGPVFWGRIIITFRGGRDHRRHLSACAGQRGAAASRQRRLCRCMLRAPCDHQRAAPAAPAPRAQHRGR